MEKNQKKQERLDELIQRCMLCLENKQKNFEPFSVQSCAACSIGQEIHRLDNPKWNTIDWNSSRFKDYYHN